MILLRLTVSMPHYGKIYLSKCQTAQLDTSWVKNDSKVWGQRSKTHIKTLFLLQFDRKIEAIFA